MVQSTSSDFPVDYKDKTVVVGMKQNKHIPITS